MAIFAHGFTCSKDLRAVVAISRELAVVGFATRSSDLDAALLVVHSPTDPTLGIDNARRIHDAAKHPKSSVSVDTAHHPSRNEPSEEL